MTFLPWRIREGFKEEATVALSTENDDKFDGRVGRRGWLQTAEAAHENTDTPIITACLENGEHFGIEGM